MDIKAAVKQLTHKHKTNNPYELAQLLNIIVMYAELGSTWGYFTTYKRSKFIIINQNISEELQAYTCAHELGHSVLHKGVSTPFLKAHTLFSIDKIERQATPSPWNCSCRMSCCSSTRKLPSTALLTW